MKKKYKLIIWAAVSLLLILLCYFIIAVNIKYPPSSLETYYIGDAVLYMNQFEVKVTGAEFLKSQEVEEIISEEELSRHKYECLVLDLTVKNVGNEAAEIELYSFVLQSGAYFNSCSLEAFLEVNKDDRATLSPLLEPGEEYSVKFPIPMLDINFKANQWDFIKQRDYELVIGLYPIKQVIKLDKVNV